MRAAVVIRADQVERFDTLMVTDDYADGDRTKWVTVHGVMQTRNIVKMSVGVPLVLSRDALVTVIRP